MNSHTRKESGVNKNFKKTNSISCEECCFTATGNGQLDIHKKTVHVQQIVDLTLEETSQLLVPEEMNLQKCNDCNFTSLSIEAFILHNETHHIEDVESVELCCSKCDFECTDEEL